MNFKPEVKMYDSCGSIRVNLVLDGKILEQHVFAPYESAKANECADKMEQGIKDAESILAKA